ncbi:hypothetical protein PCE1_000059 [Barthelona sp. PCE]
MGGVRTKTVKRASKKIIEKYYPKLTLDYDLNKKLIEDVCVIQSKRLRNKVAGYTTHLMRRLAAGPVRGISFKLLEEERERRDNYVPSTSAIPTGPEVGIIVDSVTMDMVSKFNRELNLSTPKK